jgi:hypothetical protein
MTSLRISPRMRKICIFGILVCALSLAACTPVLTALHESSGPERSLVMVEGSNLLFTRVVWDASLPTEQTLPGGFLGGYIFSVPAGSAVGNHPVAVENSYGRSGKMDYAVTGPAPFGAPRIDFVTLVSTTFDAAGNVTPLLYVQGANIDVGAVVAVNGADVATATHKGIRNELYGVDPNRLGYPIYHFLALLALPGAQKAGSPLQITVRNLDNQTSAPFAYVLPADAASLDSDGDSLRDTWEKSGYDANNDGTIDINLPGLGTDPFRKDLLLEVDVMNGLANPPIPTTPGNPGTFDMSRAVFAAAPVINPFTDSGINLIFDTSGTVPQWNTVDFNGTDSVPLSSANYSTLKAANFDNADRDNIYHYAIWARAQTNGASGISDVNFTAGCGDDLIVSFDTFHQTFQTLRSQVETLVHEFGHNLGQKHGGDNHSAYKPNYISVMAYTWQLRTGNDPNWINDAWRRRKPTGYPFYYAQAGAYEVNGAVPAGINTIVDYSDGMAATLIENNNSLDETVGVLGQPVDWNDDGDQTDVGINANVDDNGSASDTVRDFANWRSLGFNGPASDGTVVP